MMILLIEGVIMCFAFPLVFLFIIEGGGEIRRLDVWEVC